MHTHIYEPFCVYIWKVWVFDYFIDKYSSFGYVNRKSDAFDKFMEFKVESNNLLGKHIKKLRLEEVMSLVGLILSIWSMR